jgi:tetratricopeptide (TPR) repeat protein
MKQNRFFIICFLLIALSFKNGYAKEEILNPSLKLSLNITEEGLNYAVYGKSVISQTKLYSHSAIDINNIPQGASIIKAVLYWSGELEGYKSADTKVDLKDSEGNVATINADETTTTVISGLVYVSKADITKYIKGNGTYEISYIDADPLESNKTHYTLGGVALLVIFKDPQIKSTNNIQIYDGMMYITNKTLFTIQTPPLPKITLLDLALISGLGRPWDGGSVVFNGLPIGGKEFFAGNAGLSWDINRDLIFLDASLIKKEYTLEFMPDYNKVMPIVLITKFGELNKEDILRVAKSYIEQANNIDSIEIFDLKDSALEEREFTAKYYLKEILRTKAISLLKNIKSLNAQEAYELHLMLGKLYLEQDELDLAEKELKEALTLKKDNYLTYLNLSQVYYKKRDIDGAILYLKKAKELSRGNWLIYLNLGTCFMQKGLLEEAINQFEEAIKLDPKNLTPYYCLSNIYVSQGETKKQVEILHKIEAIKAAELK